MNCSTLQEENKRMGNGWSHRVRRLILPIVTGLFLLGSLTRIATNHAQASWQWSNFLNQDFWNQSPNTGNIIYSLFGDGTPGSTSYTNTWTGSCIPTSVVSLSSTYQGGTLSNNTIYLLNSGVYSLTTDITMGNCTALIGRGDVYINGNASKNIISNGVHEVILDNVKVSNGGNLSFYITASHNVSIHNVQGYNNTNYGINIYDVSHLALSHSQFYDNAQMGIRMYDTTYASINNVLSYNNGMDGIFLGNNSLYNSINNSQFFNNDNHGITISSAEEILIHNSIAYNNAFTGISIVPLTTTGQIYANNISLYNNGQGIDLSTGVLNLYGTAKVFGNTIFTGGSGDVIFSAGSPIGLSRSAATTIDTTTPGLDYDWVTNPTNGLGNHMLSGSSRSALRGVQPFSVASRPLRYIFGLYILQQTQPVAYTTTSITSYGHETSDYDTTEYIAELDPIVNTSDMSLINQYFGSGSLYTQNWDINGCSLGAFQIQYLNSGSFATGFAFQDHTIYLLTGGEYKLQSPLGTGFVFDGNCIAVVGTDTTVIDKQNNADRYLLYADGKRNIILDNLKLDGRYFNNNGSTNGDADIGVFFDGASNNTTINQVQSYNFGEYGISFGINSHHNTIINTQTYNNEGAGIYLYLVSHHNVINNTQTYNNSGYGIWFANGSHRNAMNNFQSYNNAIGVYGDLTTKQNVINRVMIYNNSEYGLRLKNSSGNMLNDVQIYNNTTGIKLEFGSLGNMYQGAFTLFDNGANMDGTNGGDANLSAGNATPEFLGGTLSTGAGIMDCSYVTNPNLSGTSIYLLDTGSNCLFTGWDTTTFSGLSYNISYLFGPHIYKQAVPVSYTSGNALQQIGAQYDSGKYIAEIFAIWDTAPENLGFLFSGADPHTWQTSAVYTAQVINTPVAINLSLQAYVTGYLLINHVPSGLSGTVVNGDAVQVALFSATGFNGVVTGTVTLGSISVIATLTTRGPLELPGTGSFAFLTLTGIDLNIYTGSTVTIDMIETGVLAQISTGRIAVYSGGSLVSSGSTGTVYLGNQVQAMIESSSQYLTPSTGVVYIGSGSGSFTVTTKADTDAPSISFVDDVSPVGYRSDSIEINFSGTTVMSGYMFVSTTGACNTGMTTSTLQTYTGAFTINNHTYNGQYICAYAKDGGNNISTLLSASSLHVSDLRLSNDVETGPVAFDTITLGQTYTANTKYAFVTTGSQCNNTASMTNYTTSLSIGSNTYNGKYLCIYGEDTNTIGKYSLSNRALNIDPNMPTLNFTDDVSSGAVFSDTISVSVSGNTSPLVYKFVSTATDCNSGGTTNYSGAITLTNETLNGKYFCAYTTFSGYQIPLISRYAVNIDRTAPTRPTPIYPIDEEELFFVSLEWTGGIDTGAGISGYLYEISADDSFLDIIDTDTILTTGSSLAPSDFTEVTGYFYRRVKAIDKLGLTSSRSTTGAFNAIDNTDFFFPSRSNATLDTLYESDEITIDGLRSHSSVLASVDRGTIYKNGTDRGDSVFVQNGDVISLGLRSSEDYDDTVSSTFTLANRSTDFSITTVADGDACTLSSGDQTAIQIIYDNLVTQYSGNQAKYDQFLATMKSMLQDRIDLDNDCNLKYLSALINKNILNNVIINTGNYIAPNCKEYGISYDGAKLAFTSPSFKTVVFFANRDALTRYIDSKNPGDCHVSSYISASWYFGNTDPSKHITPNGKIYTIQSGNNQYTAAELLKKKYFSKLIDLRKYLDGKNPPFQVWSHTVDNTFSPLTYTAPNGKVYTIYKTNRGYMSYKLLNIKYYTTLDAIKAYINKNNMK